ncbi:unnamed protein product [Cunninghamella blakesleeana]
MPHKNSFEPKDARVMNYYEEDELDDELAELGIVDPSRPTRKKKTTKTQALADFLSKTSPEEFQRSQQQQQQQQPEPSSTNFFKLRKTKRALTNRRGESSNYSTFTSTAATSTISSFSSIHSTPSIIHRKNYIEIIPKMPPPPPQQQSQQLLSNDNQSIHSLVLKSNDTPVLPQTGQLKKRESSLYSGSLRHSVSVRSQLSGIGISTSTNTNPTTSSSNHRITNNNNSRQPLLRQDTSTTLSTMTSNQYLTRSSSIKQSPTLQQRSNNHIDGSMNNNNNNNNNNQQVITQALVSSVNNMDTIEAGLIQRLERCKIAGIDKPSDIVTQALVNEHVRALDISFKQESSNQKTSHDKPKSRHMQVQTLPCEILNIDNNNNGNDNSVTPENSNNNNNNNNNNIEVSVSSSSSSSSSNKSSSTLPSSPTIASEMEPEIKIQQQQQMIEQLERQLAEETRSKQRLQASLDETKDHFEVLSALAYKKLRELWEEKLKWENACIELNHQLILLQEHSQPNMEEIISVNEKENQLSVVS